MKMYLLQLIIKLDNDKDFVIDLFNSRFSKKTSLVRQLMNNKSTILINVGNNQSVETLSERYSSSFVDILDYMHFILNSETHTVLRIYTYEKDKNDIEKYHSIRLTTDSCALALNKEKVLIKIKNNNEISLMPLSDFVNIIKMTLKHVYKDHSQKMYSFNNHKVRISIINDTDDIIVTKIY